MVSLKQNLKQILIEKQHKAYNDALGKKKLNYHMWIQEQEAELKIDSAIAEEKIKRLTNEPKMEKNGSLKLGNEGNQSKNSILCREYTVTDKKQTGRGSMTFLQPPAGLSESEMKEILEKSEADVILLCPLEGELSQITLPLLYNSFQKNKNIILIYGDEDVQEKEIRVRPWFKPDWSPDTFLSCFYFGGLTAVRRAELAEAAAVRTAGTASAARTAGTARTADTGEQADAAGSLPDRLSFLYQVCFEVIKKQGGFLKKSSCVAHIPEVLFHGRADVYDSVKSVSLQEASNYQEALKEEGESEKDLVSIIIPSKDNPQVLFKCIDSLMELTEGSYPFEIILVDNGSNPANRRWIAEQAEKLRAEGSAGNKLFKDCRYLYREMKFNFSRMCNLGAEAAEGNLFLFLNDDMEVIERDWLLKMAQKALLPYAGAVGAKLLYPDSDIIQHAGITNLRVGPAHKLQFLSDSDVHYYGRNRGVHNMLAVTGACLMIRKKVFEQAGGFGEELAVAFNDVDLCYRVFEAGFYNIQRNDVVLFHHESLSRGKDGESEEKQLRLLKEKDILYERHQEIYGKDPFYSKNLTTDMLESEYSPAFRYQVTLSMPWARVKPAGKHIYRVREDNCLVVGMESAMDIYKWRYGVSEEKGKIKAEEEDKGYYFQGYSFVIGSDNACYKKTLLLQAKADGRIWLVPVDNRYRQDIKNNLKNQVNVDLTGFAAKLRMGDLPAGSYRFGMLAEDKCSRQKLISWSSWTLTMGQE